MAELIVANERTPTQQRDDLFAPIELSDGTRTVRRWKKAKLHHHPNCQGGLESWNTVPSDILTGNQWVNQQLILRNIHEALKAGMQVTASPVRMHKGRCSGCGAEAFAASLQVAIVSGCRHVVREYAL